MDNSIFSCLAIAAMRAYVLHPRVTHHPANGNTQLAITKMSTTRNK